MDNNTLILSDDVDSRYKRTEEERARDRALMADMFARGYKTSEIVKLLNEQYPIEKQVSLRTIEADVTRLMMEWRAESVQNIAMEHAKQLLRLQAIERELWQAWDKSKGIKEIIITEAIAGGKDDKDGNLAGKKRRVQTRREQNIGDPRYLEATMKVIEIRNKLLGLNQPERMEIEMIKGMSNDDLEKLIRTTSAAIDALAANTIDAVYAGNSSDSLEGSAEAWNNGEEESGGDLFG